MDTDAEQWNFLRNQIALLSISGAFQHAPIYSKEVTVADREQFRKRLAELLFKHGEEYRGRVAERAHQENIRSICKTLTEEFKVRRCLKREKFRVGVAQKALNLYLKYLWCLGGAQTPPHCPFDRKIIDALKEHLHGKTITWTQTDSMDDYQALVDAAKEKIKNTPYESLAQWELATWNA